MKTTLTVITSIFIVAVFVLVGYKMFYQGSPIFPDLGTTIISNDQEYSPERVYACRADGTTTSKRFSGPNTVRAQHIVDTSCLGPEGNAYDEGTQLTFYETAYLSGDVEPTCRSTTKTCIDGKFQGEEGTESFVHLSCHIIDPVEDQVTCTYDGNEYLPGEVVYTYEQAYSTLDEDCTQALAYCNGNGERYTEFPTHEASNCQFLRAYSNEYVAANSGSLTVEGGSDIQPAAVACIATTTGSQCQTPWGTWVDHGESFLSFQEQQVSFDETCHVRATICNDGEWATDIEPYEHPTCQRTTPDACTFGELTIAHDTSLTFYQRNYAADGTISGCEQETKYCFNGQLSGDNSYEYLVCDPDAPEQSPTQELPEEETTPEEDALPEDSPEDVGQQEPAQEQEPDTDTTTSDTTTNTTTTQGDPNCPSPFGGSPRAPWQEGTAYLQASVPYGSSCQAVAIVCAYGSIRQGTAEAPGEPIEGDLAASCSVNEPVGCTHTCGDVAHGEELVTYQTDTIEHGAGEVCQDYLVSSTCSNGELLPAPGSYCSCEIAEPVGCVTAGGVRVSHGDSLTLYQDEQVYAEAEDGSDVCLRQFRSCLNGQWYNSDGEVSAFTYEYKTCEVVPPSQQ